MGEGEINFWRSESARIPFAVIGILVLLFSAFTSAFLINMEVSSATQERKAHKIGSEGEVLLFAEADLARALNYAGMEAMRMVGETPVVSINEDKANPYYAQDISVDDFNKNWARAMINESLNEYTKSNFQNFKFGDNVIEIEEIKDWNKVKIAPVYMKLNRSIKYPISLGKPDDAFETYYLVRVPLNISVDGSSPKEINVSTLVTSRCPLLRSMTNHFQDRLGWTGAAMGETTALTLGKVWAAGYAQYFSVGLAVDEVLKNSDIEAIVNGVLLMDETFVFNALDRDSIYEYADNALGLPASQIKKELEDGILTVENLEKSLQSGECKDSGVSEAECEQMYAEVEKKIKEPRTVSSYIKCPYGDAADIAVSGTCYKDDGSTATCGLCSSQELRNALDMLIYDARGSGDADDQGVYTSEIQTNIARHSTYDYTDCPRGYYHRSYGDWNPLTPQLYGTVPKGDRGTLAPGILGGEKYKLDWRRTHTCEECHQESYTCPSPCGGEEEPSCSTCWRTVCTQVSAPNEYKHDDVIITFHANWNSRYDLALPNLGWANDNTRNNVDDAFYQTVFSAQTDTNLEDALATYTSSYYAPKKNDIILYGSGGMERHVVSSIAPSWLRDRAVEEVKGMVAKLEQVKTPEIDPREMPYDEYMKKVSEELVKEIKNQASSLLEKSKYINEKDKTKYDSAGAKVMHLLREWFLDDTIGRIGKVTDDAVEKADDKVDAQTKNKDDLKKWIDEAKALVSNALNFPVSANMEAVKSDASGNLAEGIARWNETVRLGIDQTPDYLGVEETEFEGTKFYPLSIISGSIPAVHPAVAAGKGGLPLLPTLTPWVVTFNIWVVYVQGEIKEFKVTDANDMAIPNASVGHEGQKFVRRDEPRIEDPITGKKIGENYNISFQFLTVAPIVVPPGPQGVGDGSIDKAIECSGNPSVCNFLGKKIDVDDLKRKEK